MPHKHKRKRDEDESNFNLAPSTSAKPLAAYTKASIFSADNDKSGNKRRKTDGSKSNKTQDDTPKAFARLMAWQASGKRPNGLDNGTSTKPKPKSKASKKQKTQSLKSTNTSAASKSSPNNDTRATSTKPTTTKKVPPTPATTTTTPKILPGESLSSFSLRVDQSLPLTSHKQNPSTHPAPSLPLDLQTKLKSAQRTTKHNKRLQRMQADWRATDARLRDEREAEQDDQAEHLEEEDLLWRGVRSARHTRKGKKLHPHKNADDADDPWKDLEKRRREETRQRNLQDVVTAPPVLKKIKSKFKVSEEDYRDALGAGGRFGDKGHDQEDLLVDVGSVPNAVGSLRRREELNATRKAVIDGYRRMQGKKRGVGERLSLSRTVVT